MDKTIDKQMLRWHADGVFSVMIIQLYVLESHLHVAKLMAGNWIEAIK